MCLQFALAVQRSNGQAPNDDSWLHWALYDFTAYFDMPPVYYLETAGFMLVNINLVYICYVKIFEKRMRLLVRKILDEDRELCYSVQEIVDIKVLSCHIYLVLFISTLVFDFGFATNFPFFLKKIFTLAPHQHRWVALTLLIVTFVTINLAFTGFGYIGSQLINLIVMIIGIIYRRVQYAQRYLKSNSLSIVRPYQMLSFLKIHRQTLDYVFSFNSVTGQGFVVFLVGNCPMNATIIILLLHDETANFSKVIGLGSLALGQILVIFVAHMLFARVSRWLQAPYKMYYSQYIKCPSCPLRVRLKLVNGFAVFHTRKRKSLSFYGLTYSVFGMITMFGFGKFLFIYSKFIMFNYKKISTQPS